MQQRFNIPVLKDLQRGERFTTNVPIRFPPNAVPGSTFAQIYAVGKYHQLIAAAAPADLEIRTI